MKIYIKNMVCFGTKSYVIQELEGLGFKYNSFESGEVDFENNLSRAERKKLDQSMQQYGLELNYGGSASTMICGFLPAALARFNAKLTFSHNLYRSYSLVR